MRNKRRARLILAHWTMFSLVLCIAESAAGQGVFIAAGPASTAEFGQGYTRLRGTECLVITPAHVVYDEEKQVARYPIVVQDGSDTARHDPAQGIRPLSLPDGTLEKVAYFTVDNVAPCAPFHEVPDLGRTLEQSTKAVLRVKEEGGGVTNIPVDIANYNNNAIYIRPEKQGDTIHMGLSGSQLLIEGRRAGMLLAVQADLPDMMGVVARIDALNKVIAINFSLYPPFLTSPPDSATLVKTSAEFTWSWVPNATSYEIQYTDILPFSDNSSSEQTNIFKESGLAKRTRYYWRVRAVDGSFMGTEIKSAWSDTRSFTTGDPTWYRLTQSLVPGLRQWDEKQYVRGIAYPSLILAGGILAHVAHNNHWKFHRKALEATNAIVVKDNNERSQDWLLIRRWSVRTVLVVYVISFIDNYVFPGVAYHPRYSVSASEFGIGVSIHYSIAPGKR